MFLCSCAFFDKPYSCVFNQKAFYQNKEKWQSINLQNYNFKYEVKTYMPNPVVIASSNVKNGKGVISYIESENQDLEFSFSTIDQLFLFIEKSFKKDKEIFDKTDIGIINYEITYNKDYGYPEAVSLFSCFDYEKTGSAEWTAPVGIGSTKIQITGFQEL